VLARILMRLVRSALMLALIPGAVMLDYSLAAARRAPAPYSGQDYVNDRFSLLLGGASPAVLTSPNVNPAFGSEPVSADFPFLRAAQTIVNSYRALTGQGGSLASTDVAGEGSIVVPQHPSVTETVEGIAAIPDQLEEELMRTGGNAAPEEPEQPVAELPTGGGFGKVRALGGGSCRTDGAIKRCSVGN
jgi:hypothetical protein